jgi:hypothetical protein
MNTGKRRYTVTHRRNVTSIQGSDEDALQHDIKCNIKSNREEIKYKTQFRFPRKKCDTARYKTNGREEIQIKK